jgi:ribose transport system permease protein
VGTSGPARPAASPWVSGRRAVLLRPEFGLPAVTVLLAVFLSIDSQYFLQWQNLLNITDAVAFVGIAAAFATMVVIAGGIDLTPVTVAVMVGIVCVRALDAGLPVPIVIVVALLAAAVIGLLNGLLITLLDLNPFIVTLATNFFFIGVAYLITNGNSDLITNTTFLSMFQSTIVFSIPIATVAMAVVYIVVFVVLRTTRYGIYVFALGGGETAARLSGVPVARMKVSLYVLSAVGAGIAGVVLASSSGAVAAYSAAGANDLLTILAAVIIGGTALSGGRGTVIGTLVGIILLGMIANGLVLLNISAFYQPVVQGIILLSAIVLDEVRRRAALAAG